MVTPSLIFAIAEAVASSIAANTFPTQLSYLQSIQQ
jgi:hypothetical protein